MQVPASQVSRFDMGTPKAINDSRAMQESQNQKGYLLSAQDHGPVPDKVIYLYNIFEGWDFPPVQQPPTFPNLKIPKCPKGQKFSFTILPAYVNDPIERPGAVEGTTELSYRRRPGTEAANSLVNPDAHPRNPWEAQFRNVEAFGNRDQTGNNLNAKGVFWSWTMPDDPKLEEEIAECKKRLTNTMRALVEAGNLLNAEDNRKDITPIMHAAMEYFNLEAEWHKSHEHRVPCPNCGEPIREGIAYHRNTFGDRCIIDQERYAASVELKPQRAQEEVEEPETVPVRKPRAKTAR